MRPIKELYPKPKLNGKIGVAALFAAGVGYVAVSAFAAGVFAQFELEQSAPSGQTTIVNNAGASGGKLLTFGSGTSFNATPVPTPVRAPSPAPQTGARTCRPYPQMPDSSCTGVPAGVPLATINGDLTTSSDEQVIDGRLITGDLVVRNKNVKVQNTRIKGRVANIASSGLVIVDSDIGADGCTKSVFNNLNGTNYTLLRSHVHNSGADLIGIGGAGTILVQDSIINQACFFAGDHLDAAQWYAPGDVGHVTFIHTVLDTRPVNVAGALGNAAIFWADNPGSGTTLTVTQSKFAGGNYTLALYDAMATSRIVLDINNSTFVKNSYMYGPCASSNSVNFDGTSGIKFTNNVFDDGTKLLTCG